MAEYFSYKDNDIFMHYSRDDKPVPSDFRMHTHETYELYYFVGGSGVYRVEGTPYPLESGDILIMRPAETHYIALVPAQIILYIRLYQEREKRRFRARFWKVDLTGGVNVRSFG